MNIKYYHFHLYYNLENINLAGKIIEEVKDVFNIGVGRLWDKPVGPHTVCSCQVTVPVELFQKVSEWFLNNRKGLDLFVHPVTGNDILDHTDFVMWIGKSYKLNTDIFI